MNNIYSNNTAYNVFYDVEDGYMDLAPNPSEGKYVESFKIISKSGGKVAAGFWMIQLHMTPAGDVTGSIEKSFLDCDL